MMISLAYHIDCMDYMKNIADKFFDLAVVDPPYGMDGDTGHAGRKIKTGAGKLKTRALQKYPTDWDVAPPKEYFSELFRVSRNQIIWGANYFPLSPARGIICWDKVQPWANFSQVELAWTSFNMPAKLFRFDNRTSDKIHPTQKPVALYAWLLNNYAKPGDNILDTHLGSGSSRIAAYKLGFDFYGCEIDKHFFDTQERRFLLECKNTVTIGNKTITQQSLWQ
jgi:site-specific DNA-methyltransferase (adenine-specific)